MEVVSQTFKGVIRPTRIDHRNGNGQLVPIVDWPEIAYRLSPPSAKNIKFEFTLEYLSINYYLPTLLRIPGNSYPQFTASDKAIQRGLKLVEFKRSFPPDQNYAVQFLLWHFWKGTTEGLEHPGFWRQEHFERDYLYNSGIENRINLIKPYLVTAGDTVFGDVNYALGISIAPRYLQEGDYLEITGGYSGSISYLWEEPEIVLSEGSSGSVNIGNTPVRVLPTNQKRAVLYVQNAGSTRCYIRFAKDEYGSPLIPIVPESIPFLDPGQSLTYEHGKLFFNGGNKDGLLEKYCNSICKLPLYAICNGNSKLVFQELIFP